MAISHTAYISVGSNLGDRIENCRRGMKALVSGEEVRITRQSRFYETEPVDFTEQGWFINCVIRIETRLEPLELLDRLQAIQQEAGRTADRVRYGPRVLDLDLLLYDRLILDDPGLSLPHPRMHRRRFVLKPLCDIDPDVVHPVLGKAVRALLAELDEDGQQVVEHR